VALPDESFREKYKSQMEFLDQQFRERFEMSIQEFWKRITPKINPAKDDPVFNWHEGEEGP
jgi:hypothetical protein